MPAGPRAWDSTGEYLTFVPCLSALYTILGPEYIILLRGAPKLRKGRIFKK